MSAGKASRTGVRLEEHGMHDLFTYYFGSIERLKKTMEWYAHNKAMCAIRERDCSVCGVRDFCTRNDEQFAKWLMEEEDG